MPLGAGLRCGRVAWTAGRRLTALAPTATAATGPGQNTVYVKGSSSSLSLGRRVFKDRAPVVNTGRALRGTKLGTDGLGRKTAAELGLAYLPAASPDLDKDPSRGSPAERF